MKRNALATLWPEDLHAADRVPDFLFLAFQFVLRGILLASGQLHTSLLNVFRGNLSPNAQCEFNLLICCAAVYQSKRNVAIYHQEIFWYAAFYLSMRKSP